MKVIKLQETIVEQRVTYTLEMDEKFFIIENVPARVCIETGEQFFSPGTVEKIQEIICAVCSHHDNFNLSITT